MSYDNDNVFARILRDELPAHRVYEDDHSLAFMDVMPQVDGHTLVIPKDPTAGSVQCRSCDSRRDDSDRPTGRGGGKAGLRRAPAS